MVLILRWSYRSYTEVVFRRGSSLYVLQVSGWYSVTHDSRQLKIWRTQLEQGVEAGETCKKKHGVSFTPLSCTEVELFHHRLGSSATV